MFIAEVVECQLAARESSMHLALDAYLIWDYFLARYQSLGLSSPHASRCGYAFRKCLVVHG